MVIMALLHYPHLHMYHYLPGLLSVVDLWFVVPLNKLVFVPQNILIPKSVPQPIKKKKPENVILTKV
jgi:hypothetical protein